MEETGHVSSEQVKIIANRFEKNGAVSVDQAEQIIGNKFSFTIPNDYKSTMDAINAGKSLSEIAPKSSVRESFQQLASSIAEPLPIEKPTTKRKRLWLF